MTQSLEAVSQTRMQSASQNPDRCRKLVSVHAHFCPHCGKTDILTDANLELSDKLNQPLPPMTERSKRLFSMIFAVIFGAPVVALLSQNEWTIGRLFAVLVCGYSTAFCLLLFANSFIDDRPMEWR